MPQVIPTVIATTYYDVCSTGATRPCRFSCVNSHSHSFDYVVKFYGAIGPAVICETMASLLARRLGVNVPECAIVAVPPPMSAVVRDEEARRNLAKHDGPHFGSMDIGPGAAALSEGFSLTGKALEQAFDIFAFDMLIQNMDRTAFGQVGKPNILYRGSDLYPIDHEKAFSFVNLLAPDGLPWEIRNKSFADRHIFQTRLRHHSHSNVGSDYFDRFIDRLAALRIEDIQKITQSLPAEWYNERYVTKILDHFRLVLDNHRKFHMGLLEAIA